MATYSSRSAGSCRSAGIEANVMPIGQHDAVLTLIPQVAQNRSALTWAPGAPRDASRAKECVSGAEA